MTRAEMAMEIGTVTMALRIRHAVMGRLSKADTKTHALCLDVAAELRKTCATCAYFGTSAEPFPHGDCHVLFGITGAVPVDGSGYCHKWEAKP